MKKVLFLVLAIAVSVLVYRGVQASIDRSTATVMTIENYQQQDGIPVATDQAASRKLQTLLSYTGTIKGLEQADVTASVQVENVLDIKVKPGHRVNAGDVLVILDDKITGEKRLTAKALEDAKRDFERTQELLKAGAVSQQLLDKAELAYSVAQAQFDAADWRHKATAPISGTVTDVFVEKGQTVSAGIPLLRVAQLHKVITEIKVAETEMPLIKNGMKAVVKTRSFPDEIFEGKVTETSLSTNPGSRNFTVEITIPNEGRLLKPGMFTTVDIVVEEKKEAVAIHKDAVVKDNGAYYVFVVDGNSVNKTEVTPGITDENWVEIPEGIQLGQQIVVEGHNKLENGTKIVVVNN